MRIAAIYDIHANLPAREAVISEIRQAAVDKIVVGGDVVHGSRVKPSTIWFDWTFPRSTCRFAVDYRDPFDIKYDLESWINRSCLEFAKATDENLSLDSDVAQSLDSKGSGYGRKTLTREDSLTAN